MTDFVSNGPISMPIKLRGVTPEVDMNGLCFSYQWGLVYNPPETVVPLQLPSSLGPSPQAP